MFCFGTEIRYISNGLLLVCGDANDENEKEFEKIFSHDTTAGVFKEHKVHDNDNPKLFSKLKKLKDNPEAYKTNGKFHFKLCYPDLDRDKDKKCNEWKQSSNPVKDGKITGYEPIDINFNKNGNGDEWGGLGKSGHDHTLMDDTGSDPEWNMAVGALKFEPNKNKIPGPKGEKGITKVKLFVKKGMLIQSSLLNS